MENNATNFSIISMTPENESQFNDTLQIAYKLLEDGTYRFGTFFLF